MNGKLHGKVEYRYMEEGEYYIGDYTHGKQTGVGILRVPAIETCYEGEFVDGEWQEDTCGNTSLYCNLYFFLITYYPPRKHSISRTEFGRIFERA